MTDAGWMTRQEAAEYLKVSIRQLTRLRLPRTMLGSSPRYSRATIDQHLERHSVAPGRRTKGGLVGPPSLSYLAPANVEEQISRMKTDLRRQSRRR